MVIKIYVMADRAATCISISNFLNSGPNKAIASEAESHSYNEQLEELESHKEEFGLFIIVSENPTSCVIEANKLDEIRAVSCKSEDDVKEAMESKANVLVFNSIKMGTDQISEALEELGGNAPQRIQAKESTHQQENIKQKLKPKKILQTKPTLPEDKSPLWDGNKSITKNIKNIFGVD